MVSVRRQLHVPLLEIEMSPSHTVRDLKQAIFELSGVPVEEQRLYLRSRRLGEDAQALNSTGLGEVSEVQLVPALTHRATTNVAPIFARRGFNMVPGTPPWKPSRHARLSHGDVLEFHGQPTQVILLASDANTDTVSP